MRIFLIDHHVKPEYIDDYQLAVREDARNSLLEGGILRFEVYQDIQNPPILHYWKPIRIWMPVSPI